jgi:hypothetical protein
VGTSQLTARGAALAPLLLAALVAAAAGAPPAGLEVTGIELDFWLPGDSKSDPSLASTDNFVGVDLGAVVLQADNPDLSDFETCRLPHEDPHERFKFTVPGPSAGLRELQATRRLRRGLRAGDLDRCRLWTVDSGQRFFRVARLDVSVAHAAGPGGAVGNLPLVQARDLDRRLCALFGSELTLAASPAEATREPTTAPPLWLELDVAPGPGFATRFVEDRLTRLLQPLLSEELGEFEAGPPAARYGLCFAVGSAEWLLGAQRLAAPPRPAATLPGAWTLRFRLDRSPRGRTDLRLLELQRIVFTKDLPADESALRWPERVVGLRLFRGDDLLERREAPLLEDRPGAPRHDLVWVSPLTAHSSR